LASFYLHENPNFKKVRKTAKNEENPRKSRVFRLASFLSTRVGGTTRNFAPCAKIRTLYAWQASLPISEWRMRTGFGGAWRGFAGKRGRGTVQSGEGQLNSTEPAPMKEWRLQTTKKAPQRGASWFE